MPLGWFLGGLSDLPPARAHDYHVGVAEVQWTSSGFEVSALFFADDLERGVQTSGVPWDTHRADSLLRPYMKQHFGLIHSPSVEWVGHRSEGAQIRCFFRVPFSAEQVPSSQIRLRFDVLMDVYPDQKNLLHIQKNGRRQSYYFSARNPIQTLQ